TIPLLAILLPNFPVPRMPTVTTLAPPRRLTITSGARTTTNQFKLCPLATWRPAALQLCPMRTSSRTAPGIAVAPTLVRLPRLGRLDAAPVFPSLQPAAAPPAQHRRRAPSRIPP